MMLKMGDYLAREKRKEIKWTKIRVIYKIENCHGIHGYQKYAINNYSSAWHLRLAENKSVELIQNAYFC